MTGFRDRHVVVTGGFGALGVPVVQALLDAGASCHVPDRSGSVPAELQGRDRVHAIACIDLADEASVTSLYAALPPLWASIHIVGGFAMAPVTETSLAEFQRMMTMNAATCFLCCREAVRAIRATGQGGRIVNVAARPVLEPAGGMVAYVASKAAVAAITRSLAAELVSDGILVNAVAPSIIDTAANRAAMPDADHDRWPKPDELARAMLYLASPDNALTSGATMPVYGKA
jgi:NAD(P)-dependent dehydrogenase (short-subunit alcohol dehydrogenase family)